MNIKQNEKMKKKELKNYMQTLHGLVLQGILVLYCVTSLLILVYTEMNLNFIQLKNGLKNIKILIK